MVSRTSNASRTRIDTPEDAAAGRRVRRSAVSTSPVVSPRHLTFQDVNRDDEVTPAKKKKAKKKRKHRDDDDEANDDDDETTARSADRGRVPRSASGRRATVMWTPAEEKQLIEGVRVHGLGQWLQILLDGRDVFHEHRSNVDLKDKWKNLLKRSGTFGEENPLRAIDEMLAGQGQKQTRRRQARRPAKRKNSRTDDGESPNDADELRSNENESLVEDSDDERARFARVKQERHQDATVELLIGTDESFPELHTLSISTHDCPTVSVLKRELLRRLVDGPALPTNPQLVSIKTRRLVAELEAVDDCVKRDGNHFFLLYDP